MTAIWDLHFLYVEVESFLFYQSYILAQHMM